MESELVKLDLSTYRFFQGYEYQETDFDECCGKCVQTHCVASVNGTDKLLKVSWIISFSCGPHNNA